MNLSFNWYTLGSLDIIDVRKLESNEPLKLKKLLPDANPKIKPPEVEPSFICN